MRATILKIVVFYFDVDATVGNIEVSLTVD